VRYTVPRLHGLSVYASAAYVVSGRNVGQATTFSSGFLYTFAF
jgi:hypothetical protein